MKFADRILTIVITATLTSAAWIVFGTGLIDAAGDRQGEDDVAGPNGPATTGNDAPETAERAAENRAAAGLADGATSPSPRPGSIPDGRRVIPVQGVSANALTDTFLDDRGSDGMRRHEAIDIMADTGTAVLAFAPGTIAKLHRSGPGGNSIYVRSGDRLQIHYYAHLDQYDPSLREGQQVRTGQRLGTVGSTGNADPAAPHLHFAVMETTRDAEWWEPANAINPYPLLKAISR